MTAPGSNLPVSGKAGKVRNRRYLAIGARIGEGPGNPPMAAIRAVGCVTPVTEFLCRWATLSVFTPLKGQFDGGPCKTQTMARWRGPKPLARPARHFRECHVPASTEIAVDIWCSSSAASRTSLSAIFPVSTQTMLRQAGSPRSTMAAAFSAQGFHTTLEAAPTFSMTMRRRHPWARAHSFYWLAGLIRRAFPAARRGSTDG